MGLKRCCDNVGAFVECCAKPMLDVWRVPDEHYSEIYCINCGASILFLLDILWANQAALTPEEPRILEAIA